MNILPFSAAHVEGVAALEQRCFADPWSVSGLEEELSNPCARFLVAEVDGFVAGYLGCHHIADEGFITNVAVHPDYRRHGIARALLCAALEQGAALFRVTLEVRVSNTAAIALYESLGFVRDGVRPRFYAHPTEDAAIYSYYQTK